MRGPVAVTDPDPAALAALWARVTDAGGSVGFAPGCPRAEIAGTAAKVCAAVRAGSSRLLALSRDDDTLLGFAVFTLGERSIRRHNMVLDWLMIDPAAQAGGLGRRLLAAAEHAAAELGASTAFLATRTGHDLERFYTSCGWQLAGRWPDAVRLSEQDWRDELWFVKRLTQAKHR